MTTKAEWLKQAEYHERKAREESEKDERGEDFSDSAMEYHERAAGNCRAAAANAID